jgi:DNA-binding transcriptional ArsR family regulator
MSIDDVNPELDLVFKALANPVRRRICDELRLRPLTTKQLCLGFPELDRCTVMLHLGVLERAGLVVAVKKGRERFNYLDAMPIQAIHERWIGPHAAHAAERLLHLKRQLEPQPAKVDQAGP